ncbi:flavodoxin family protein [Desulfovibrio sulfodismutans]|uniref:Flavodoxin family protein n=1 Tax=Desulfolutivibrio sulfodismutans TaxID=63561 RepID=A0A7K3NLS3_9BACT|nr:flavodoxin family protein [Desulfolutivibrio sulfodismutans]NDY56725.1 flavodoxin family protein [Desulfolutivibrio sulfodismutans]QLA13996.1 flavodoxin family protein [Desulfolutivibrio sulfodismutans DSM 3696]
MNAPRPDAVGGQSASPAAPVVVLCCSPRAGGNSDLAGQAVARGVLAAGGESRTYYLREHCVLPCVGCGACAASPGHRCVLGDKDDAETLFAAMRYASAIVLASPIYFYHVPAGLKALIDRGQRFHAAVPPAAGAEGGDAADRPEVHVILVSGRKKGAKLFDGALLSLKYFFEPMGLALAEPTLLRGYDAAGDLSADTTVGARLAWRGGELWRELAARKMAG